MKALLCVICSCLHYCYTHLDHAFPAPAIQPLNGTLLEEGRIALTVHSKFRIGTVHYQHYMQIGLNLCKENKFDHLCYKCAFIF